jgi:L,D-peptidoglycan transpeptidase YkuD (ErfK/YbiS/YcfS/YnhG family)
MPQRAAILRIVAQVAPEKADAVAALLSQPQPSRRRRKGGTLVRHERDEALADEWRRQQAIKAAVRELERRELQRENARATTIFVYDERTRFRKVPAPTARHPVPSILSGKVRAGKARIVKCIIELDEANNLRVFDWSALLKQRRI